MAAVASTARARESTVPDLAGVRAPSPRPGAAITVVLLLAILYAAFAHGATALGDEARVQIVLALAAAVACGAWLWHGGLRLAAAPWAWAGLALLTGFAVWSGITLDWSIAPARTWIELNRAVAYVLVVALALAAGAWDARAPRRLALGYLAVAMLVSLYALGGKLVPGLHIPGIINLNHTSHISRLRAPLDYWNALALFCVMAVPIALRLAVEVSRPRSWRLAGLVCLALLAVTIGLTYSRGGVLAAIVAVAVTIALAGDRLRSLLMLGLALAGAALPLAVGFSVADLTTNGVSLAHRETAGSFLILWLVLSVGALVLAGRFVLAVEERTPADPERSRRIGRALGVAAGVAVLAVVIGLAFSSRGLTGSISHAWRDFRTPKTQNVFDPARLLTTNAGNRWVWWKEAAGAWSDRPLRGWGAGSFPVLHREYRTNRLDVQQPHDVPLQFLAETGLIGAVLAIGGLLAMAAAGFGGIRARVRERRAIGVEAALAGASAAWLVHTLYDWDWDIPGVTIPALVFLGVLAGAAGRRTLEGRRSPPQVAGPGARALALVAATLLLCAAGLSALLPSWSNAKSEDALRGVAGGRSEATLVHFQREAVLAAKLNSLSTDGLIVASQAADQRGLPAAARRYLLDAIRRDPNDLDVWSALALLVFRQRNTTALRQAAAKALALDPHNRIVRLVASEGVLFAAPPAASATATGTPLPITVKTTVAAPVAPVPAVPAAPAAPGTTPAVPPGH